MNKTQKKLSKYIESIGRDIDRLEESNSKETSNVDLTIATVLRDVKEDLVEILEGK